MWPLTRTGDAMAVRAVERRRDAKERGRQRAAKRNDERNEQGWFRDIDYGHHELHRVCVVEQHLAVETSDRQQVVSTARPVRDRKAPGAKRIGYSEYAYDVPYSVQGTSTVLLVQ
jgi:hypothetical protein